MLSCNTSFHVDITLIENSTPMKIVEVDETYLNYFTKRKYMYWYSWGEDSQVEPTQFSAAHTLYMWKAWWMCEWHQWGYIIIYINEGKPKLLVMILANDVDDTYCCKGEGQDEWVHDITNMKTIATLNYHGFHAKLWNIEYILNDLLFTSVECRLGWTRPM